MKTSQDPIVENPQDPIAQLQTSVNEMDQMLDMIFRKLIEIENKVTPKGAQPPPPTGYMEAIEDMRRIARLR